VRLVIVLLLGFAPLFAACDRQSSEASQEALSAPGMNGAPSASHGGSQEMGRVSIEYRGQPAPDLSFSDPDGRSISFAELEGQPLLVNLWATWCPPCIAEMPTLDSLAAREAGALRVMTISEDLQGAEVVTPFFAENDFAELEQWLDPDNAMMAALALDTLPVTILYDAEGRELFRVIGGMDWAGERADTLISGAIGEE